MFKNRRGASLIMVIMLMFFVMIVGLGVVAIAGSSSGQTTVALTQRQADLTAQSVLNALVSQIKTGKIIPDATKELNNGTGYITATNLGDYQYTIKSYNYSTTDFKVTVDAWYPKQNQGSESKMYSVVHKNVVQSGPVFNSVVQLNSANTLSAQIQGTLIIDANNGTVDLTLNSGGTACTGLYVKGNLNTYNNFTANGPVYVTGNVAYNSTLNGNVYAGGTVAPGSWGGGAINGTVYQHYNGTIFPYTTPPAWTVSSAVKQSMSQIQFDLNMNATGNQQYYTVIGNDDIVSSNCTIKSFTFVAGKRIVFDATSQDIYVMLATSANNGSTINVPGSSGVDFLTKGSHNVYLFLDDSNGNTTGNYVNLNVAENSIFGYYNLTSKSPDGRIPNLYIIANLTSTINFNAQNSLYGYIYAPNGTLNTGNGCTLPSKIYGAAVAKSINLNGNLNYTGIANLNGWGGSGGGGALASWNTLGTYVGN